MKKAMAAIITLAMAAGAASARAVEWRLGEDTQLKVSGAVTFGTGIRTENPRPENYGSLAGTRGGRSDGLTAANSGGPNLNFEQGSAYSTVLKAFADFDIGRRSFGAFARPVACGAKPRERWVGDCLRSICLKRKTVSRSTRSITRWNSGTVLRRQV